MNDNVNFSNIFLKLLKDDGQLTLTHEIAVIASNNRLLFFVATHTKGKLADQITSEGRSWISKLEKTLNFIAEVLDNELPYLIVRTFKFLPFVTYDVDVFVPPDFFDAAVDRFKRHGADIESHDNALGGRLPRRQVNVLMNNLLTIDLHQNFTWQKRLFLNVDQIEYLKVPRIIGNVKVNTPRPEVEFILCVSDISHERFFVTLADLFFIKNLAEEIEDWEYVFREVQALKWLKTFLHVSEILNGLALSVFKKSLIPKTGYKNLGNPSWPYFFPLSICWLSFYENLTSNRSTPLLPFLYFHYGRLKHYLTGSIPYYHHWSKYLGN